MARSLKKGPFFHRNLLQKVQDKKDFRNIQLWSRSSTILPEFIGHKFEVHNGRSLVLVTVSDEMVGHKFGEFASTRKPGKHKLKKGKK